MGNQPPGIAAGGVRYTMDKNRITFLHTAVWDISTASGMPDVYLDRDPGMGALTAALGEHCAEADSCGGAFWDRLGEETLAVIHRFARPRFPLKLDIHPARGVANAVPLLIRLARVTGAVAVADLGVDDADGTCAIFHPSGAVEAGSIRMRYTGDDDNPLMSVTNAQGCPVGA